MQKAEREAAAAAAAPAGANVDKGKAPMQTQVSLGCNLVCKHAFRAELKV